MSRVLVVEDDPDIAQLIARYLAAADHQVRHLTSGAEALGAVRDDPPDLVILDWMLPELSGLDVCEALRRDAATSSLPILMLTARGEEADRVRGLERGADDYVTKPFSPKELTARVGALLRRAGRPAASLLRYGPITIDDDRHAVLLDGREVTLTAKEFLLLQCLVRRRGRLLSRDVLLSDVWGYEYTGGTRTVDVHIRRLREKLPVLVDAIETVKQFGYRLADRP